MLAPLTSLVGECGQTKVAKVKKTKKRAWYWDEVHQTVFENVKTTIAKDAVLPILTTQTSLTLTPHLNNLAQ